MACAALFLIGLSLIHIYGAKGSFRAQATKRLEGRELKAGEFSFELVDKDGKVVATAKNGADGKISFGKVELKGAGERSYRCLLYTSRCV